MADDDGLWHLLIHTPGANADPEVPFFQAEWFPGHRGFHATLQQAGYFVAAGPMPERPGAGQTLVRGVSTGEITRLARETDPAVVGGFLRVDIVPWQVVESVLD
ncbi:hypothetical protein BH09ACT4_BH09ACT4_08400 [soil metagenome]